LITTGGAYVNDVAIGFDSSNASSTFNIWVGQGGWPGALNTAAGISYVFDEDRDGVTSKTFNLTADAARWVSNLYYDSVNDDLYVVQTRNMAVGSRDNIWSKIASPKITADSTIDAADGTSRITGMAYTYDITADADNVYFATVDGIKKVAKATFSSGVTDTLDTTDFPELPAGNDSYTKLLLHGDGLNTQVTDFDYSSSNHILVFNADAQISTTQSKFGGSSYYLDGTGDYISSIDSADWNFGSGDFTIDFWARFGSVAQHQPLFSHNTDANNYLNAYWDQSLQRIYFAERSSSVTHAAYYASWTPAVNTWYHIAMVRNGSAFKIFIDGIDNTVEATAIGSSTLGDFTGAFLIGYGPQGVGAVYLNGYVDEFRVSKGVARWTSGFAIPTEPHHFSVRAIDYDSNMNRLICAFDQLMITSTVAGFGAIYYDHTSETDLDRNNELSSSLFRAAKWLGNFRSGYNGFAIGGNDGVTIGNWSEASEPGGSRVPRAPIIGNTGSFLIF